MHSNEANQARETISKAVVQEHMRSIKSKQLLVRSNSLNEMPTHAHQVRPRTASHVATHQSSGSSSFGASPYAQKSSSTLGGANVGAANSSSFSSVGILRSVYSEVAYNDLKMRKIDQVRDVLWSHFVHSCLANSNDCEAYVNKLCKQNQIYF